MCSKFQLCANVCMRVGWTGCVRWLRQPSMSGARPAAALAWVNIQSLGPRVCHTFLLTYLPLAHTHARTHTHTCTHHYPLSHTHIHTHAHAHSTLIHSVSRTHDRILTHSPPTPHTHYLRPRTDAHPYRAIIRCSTFSSGPSPLSPGVIT